MKAHGFLPRIRSFLSHRIIANIYWLSVTQLVSYVCPLLNVVFLTRALGPSAWGTLATFQALSNWFNLVIEYGFSLSGAREVAQSREDPGKLERALASVLWAKLTLASALAALVLCGLWVMPLLHDHPRLTVCAIAVAMGPSLTPMWFYQGLEQMRAAAIIEVSGRLTGTVLTVSFVRHPSQIWMALLIPGLASLTATAINYARLYFHYSFILPSPRLVWHALTFGWSMFVYRSSISLYTIGNAFILALFVAPEYVGYYAAAERVARYSTAVLAPLSQALFPRISYLTAVNFAQAANLAAKSFRIIAAIGVFLGAVTFFAAPLVVPIFLGQRFDGAIPALRILSLLPPIMAISSFVGLHWLVPLRKDAVVNISIVSAGVANLLLALLLAPRFRQNGMAWAVVIAETIVTVLLLIYLQRKHLFPASGGGSTLIRVFQVEILK
jgi:PST family polysaccharide transporter